jgi:hypothetical protein
MPHRIQPTKSEHRETKKIVMQDNVQRKDD